MSQKRDGRNDIMAVLWVSKFYSNPLLDLVAVEEMQ